MEWLALRRGAEEADRHRLVPKVVTVTGQYGALGTTVAGAAAQALGYPLFDREIIKLIAERAGTLPSLVEAAENTPSNYLELVFSRFIPRARLEDGDYIRHLADVIGMIGERGSAVVVGRASNVLLGGERAFRVRCIASVGLRASRVADLEGLAQGAAEARVREEDRRREQSFRGLVGLDITAPALYDLVISTDHLSPEEAAEIVVAGVRAHERARGR